MVNYYNILPIIILHIFIIILFEGLLFFYYLIDKQEQFIHEQLLLFNKNIIEYVKKNKDNVIANDSNLKMDDNIDNIENILKMTLDIDFIKDKTLSKILDISADNEEKYINKYRKKAFIRFFLLLLSLLLILVIYIWIVNKYNKIINWSDVLYVVLFTIILIVILEGLYVLFILFYKKLNYSEIKLSFLDAFRK